jgi:transposase
MGSSSRKALPTSVGICLRSWRSAKTGLPETFQQLLGRLGDHLKAFDRQVQELKVKLQSWHRENVASKKLAQNPGIGLNTARYALIASVGDAKSFKNGRQLVAWLGLVPR